MGVCEVKQDTINEIILYIMFFGGRLTPTSLQAGAYNTTNTGGAPLAVRVVVQ
jgi:hypothetical protein